MNNKLLLLLLLWVTVLSISSPVYASEKSYSVSVNKDYKSAKLVVERPLDDLEYAATITSPNGKNAYKGISEDGKDIEVIINDALDRGDWTLNISRNDGNNDVVDALKGVKVRFAGSLEKLADTSRDITIEEDIVGLKMYFKDDNFVAEWTDTTCGDVNIEVTNEKTLECLDKMTVTDERYYELPIDKGIESIIVSTVPSMLPNVEDAHKRYVFEVNNNPDATITFEDMDITNKDEITYHVSLGDTYYLVVYRNGEKNSCTDILEMGEYDFTVSTEVGDNDYLVYVVDMNGNMRSTKGYVYKDVIAPVLQLEKEYTEIVTEDESIDICGKVEDYDYFTINDTEVKVEGDHTFNYTYSLKEGQNIINIVASDKAGNVSSFTGVIVRKLPEENNVPISKIVLISILSVCIVIFIILSIKPTKKNTSRGDKEVVEKRKNTKNKKSNEMPTILEIIGYFVPAIVVLVIFTKVIFVSTIMSGCMQPLIMTGNTAFYNMLYYKHNDIQRGDIVIFHSNECDKEFSKRVIGLPNDKIEFRDGYVVINGQYLDESAYLSSDIETNSSKTFEVPEGCYFLMGDNRENSLDSRYWVEPYIKEEDIYGKFIGQIPISLSKLFGEL